MSWGKISAYHFGISFWDILGVSTRTMGWIANGEFQRSQGIWYSHFSAIDMCLKTHKRQESKIRQRSTGSFLNVAFSSRRINKSQGRTTRNSWAKGLVDVDHEDFAYRGKLSHQRLSLRRLGFTDSDTPAAAWYTAVASTNATEIHTATTSQG